MHGQADVEGPLRQDVGDVRFEDAPSFWARGYRQVREPAAEALWARARRGEGASASSSSAASSSAPPRPSLRPPSGVDPRSIPPPDRRTRMDRIREQLDAPADDMEDISD